MAGGAADRGALAGEAGADGGIKGAFAAVGYWDPEDIQVIAGGRLQAPFQVPADVRGRQRSLELVRRDHDPHVRPAGPGWRWGRPPRTRPVPQIRSRR